METPNKIYLEKDKETDKIHHLWGRFPVIHSGYEHIEYIRKDALLEWASRLKEKWEEPPMSRHSPGCVFMLEQLINKLNSM